MLVILTLSARQMTERLHWKGRGSFISTGPAVTRWFRLIGPWPREPSVRMIRLRLRLEAEPPHSSRIRLEAPTSPASRRDLS